MSLFRRKRKTSYPAVQTAPSAGSAHPFGAISRYTPLSSCERQLYRSLRESVPIIDAAIGKIVRLVGGFSVRCRSSAAQKELDSFLKTVRCGGVSKGINCFISQYLEQLLTYGTAVGEIVPDGHGEIAALYNSSLDDVELEYGQSPLDIRVMSYDGAGVRREVSFPSLILCSVLMPEPGSIYGTSILKGLPFVTDILLKIFNTIGTNWERVGNVRFAVTYKPQESERAFSKDRAMLIASQWSKAMKSREPRDFISVGDVSIKAIGADNVMPDCNVPVRCITEQIVSKLAIPPFLLGLSWSSTERMSSQQADILTSELEYYRGILEPVISRICSVFLKLRGYESEHEMIWDNIDLQDEVELARARLYNAQAKRLEKDE